MFALAVTGTELKPGSQALRDWEASKTVVDHQHPFIASKPWKSIVSD
jgi:hypothetical protein